MLSPTLSAQVPIPADELSLRAAPYFPSPAAGVIRAQVALVEVPAVVRDSNGIAVPNLTREDFEVLDSGKKRQISAFSVKTFSHAGELIGPGISPNPEPTLASQSESKPPRRYIAFVLDDLNTDFASLRRGKIAAEKFVSESLTPGDLVGVFTTASPQPSSSLPTSQRSAAPSKP